MQRLSYPNETVLSNMITSNTNYNSPIIQRQSQKTIWTATYFLISSPSLWGNKNWTPQYKDQGDGKMSEQNQLNRLEMVQFACPKYRNPSHNLGCVHFLGLLHALTYQRHLTPPRTGILSVKHFASRFYLKVLFTKRMN